MGALKVALGAVCSQIITQMWVVSAPPSILVHGALEVAMPPSDYLVFPAFFTMDTLCSLAVD